MELTPKFPFISFSRAMLLTPEIHDLVYAKTQNAERRSRCEALRANLEAFAVGDVVSVCQTPFKARTAYMGRLNPTSEGIFDIRSRDPSPAIRVIGAFPMRDVFVAITWAPRSKQFNWSNKKPLGRRQSNEWRSIIRHTKSTWQTLFPNTNKISGDNLNDIISQNAIAIEHI